MRAWAIIGSAWGSVQMTEQCHYCGRFMSDPNGPFAWMGEAYVGDISTLHTCRSLRLHIGRTP